MAGVSRRRSIPFTAVMSSTNSAADNVRLTPFVFHHGHRRPQSPCKRMLKTCTRTCAKPQGAARPNRSVYHFATRLLAASVISTTTLSNVIEASAASKPVKGTTPAPPQNRTTRLQAMCRAGTPRWHGTCAYPSAIRVV